MINMTNYDTMWEIIMVSDTSTKDGFFGLYKLVENISIEHLYSFYEMLKKIVTDNQLLNRPGNHNCDTIALITIFNKLKSIKNCKL